MDSFELRSTFGKLIRQWSAWYRWRRASAWLLRGLIVGLLLSLGITLPGLLQAGLLHDEFLRLIFRITLACAALAALAGWAAPVSKDFLARFFDQQFALHERSRTSLELISRAQQLTETSVINHALIEQQLRDTLAIGSQVSPKIRFFFKITRSQATLIFTLTLGLALISFFGEPIFKQAAQQRQVRQAIAQEAARLEALVEEIQKNETLAPAQKQEIIQTLSEASEKLNQALSPEQAVAALVSAEEKLRGLQSEQAQAQAESLQNAGKRLLEENPAESGSPLASFAQNLADQDYLGAAQDLANLDLDPLSSEELDSMAEQLKIAAQMLEGTNPELSRQMEEAAQALREGDRASAQKALQKAAQRLSEAGAMIAQEETAGQAAEAVSQGEERLIAAGTSPSAQGQAGEGQSAGNQSSSSSQGAGGSGAGSGESLGEESQGPEAGDKPIGQNNQPGDSALSDYEAIYAPQRLGGSTGDEVNLPESGQPGDQVLGQGNTSPGDDNSSRVPYVDVLPSYAEAYRQAIESGQVPVTLRSLVKKYFSSLEP